METNNEIQMSTNKDLRFTVHHNNIMQTKKEAKQYSPFCCPINPSRRLASHISPCFPGVSKCFEVGIRKIKQKHEGTRQDCRNVGYMNCNFFDYIH